MYTEALAATTWELNAIPGWGTLAYIGIVGCAAITEYGPQLMKLAELAGDVAQNNGGSSGGSSGSNQDPKNIFRSIKQSPNYPEGFKAVQNGTQKYNITNKGLLEKLRDIEPGNWQKVYKDGFDAAGNKVSIHYFESPSGQVFDVATKSGWSNF